MEEYIKSTFNADGNKLEIGMLDYLKSFFYGINSTPKIRQLKFTTNLIR